MILLQDASRLHDRDSVSGQPPVIRKRREGKSSEKNEGPLKRLRTEVRMQIVARRMGKPSGKKHLDLARSFCKVF